MTVGGQDTCVPGSVPPGGASFPDSFRLRCALTRPGCTCSPPPEASPPSTVPVGDSVMDCRGMGGFWWDLRGWREQRATFIPPARWVTGPRLVGLMEPPAVSRLDLFQN